MGGIFRLQAINQCEILNQNINEMAGRPTKQGIDYFPLDVGFFSDVKVRKIARACGPQSTSILICLLCNIYKDNGYYILWDEDLPFVIADIVGVSEGAVKEVLTKAIQVGFFDAEIFSVHGVLTSAGIQKRFLLATYQRKETEIIPEYMINGINHANNSINCTKNSINHMDNGQSKVKVNRKKNKENSTNVEQKKAEQAKKLAAAKAATLSRKDSFYDSLIPYVERYGREMVRDFFDYWSEMNKSETKMRFEQQTTWEVAKRLATWSKREKINGKQSYSVQSPGTYIPGRTSKDNAASRQSLEDLADAILGQH